jgi:hypothetical protein
VIVVAQLDSELPLLRVMSMDGVIEAQRGGHPLFSRLLVTLAILALILSAIGIYGPIACLGANGTASSRFRCAHRW